MNHQQFAMNERRRFLLPFIEAGGIAAQFGEGASVKIRWLPTAQFREIAVMRILTQLIK
jgi:hypothetical protein